MNWIQFWLLGAMIYEIGDRRKVMLFCLIAAVIVFIFEYIK